MSTAVGTYDDVAEEYYDTRRHPTSSNFRELSVRLISRWLSHTRQLHDWTCDVGAGKSVLAELLAQAGVPLNKLVLLDASLAMLAHSRSWKAHGAQLLCGDATLLPFRDNTLRLMVSSLGDPFNTPRFWTETHRVLQPGGWIIFTTPSNAWAEEYRSRMNQDRQKAEFDLRNRGRVYVPS